MKKTLTILAITGATLFALFGFAACVTAVDDAMPETVVTERPEALPEPEAKEPIEEPAETVAQDQATLSAAGYLDLMGMSREALIEQLVFEGFSQADAEHGVDSLGADYNAEAAESAADYLDIMPMSRQGLIEQLVFDGFTAEQAEYGVATVGL